MSKESNSSSGIGFFGALTLLFIGLKLTNVIDWPWWIVLAPIYGPLVIIIIILLLAALYTIIKVKIFGK